MISPYRNGTDTWHPIVLHCQSFGCWILGPRFNIKMSSYQYRKSHCVDKTVIRSSYLHNGISYTGKTTSLYWIRALAALRLQSQCFSSHDIGILLELLKPWIIKIYIISRNKCIYDKFWGSVSLIKNMNYIMFCNIFYPFSLDVFVTMT